jgi:hypothetical protein
MMDVRRKMAFKPAQASKWASFSLLFGLVFGNYVFFLDG